MARYGWLLLDADGTLLDFDSAQASALERTWASFDLDPFDDLLRRFRSINSKLWADYELGLVSQEHLKFERFAELLEDTGQQADPHRMSAAFVRNLSQEGGLLAGARAFLEHASVHCRLALVTNGIAEVQRGRIAAAGIEQYFSAVLISGEIGAAKPARAFFDATFSACGQPAKEDTVIVGDGLSSDIQGGVDYGIDTCWFDGHSCDPPQPEPTYRARDYDELRDVLALA